MTITPKTDNNLINMARRPLIPWDNYQDFCAHYGLVRLEEAQAIFRRIQEINFTELLLDPECAQIIRAIQALPEYNNNNALPHPAQMNTQLEALERFQKQLEFLLDNIHDHPEKTARAWLQLIASMEALPTGTEKTRYLEFLNIVKEKLYLEGYILHHIDTPVLWQPALDLFIRQLQSQPEHTRTLSPSVLWEINQLSTPIQIELISQLSALITYFDEAIFIAHAKAHPEHLELILQLTQHVPTRFNLWLTLIEAQPAIAPQVIDLWQSHIPRLNAQEHQYAQEALSQVLPAHLAVLVEPLMTAHKIALMPALTAREQQARAPTKPRDTISKRLGAGLFQLAAIVPCMAIGVKANYLMARHYAKCLVGAPDNKALEWAKEIKASYLTILRILAQPYVRTRLFENTGDETFISTLSNASRMYCDADLLQKFEAQLNRPPSTDAEFYAEHLYHPEGFNYLWKTLRELPDPPCSNPPLPVYTSKHFI